VSAARAGCKKGDVPPPSAELVIEDLTIGTGAEAVAGKVVTVHYTGWLTNGTKFDSSVDRNEPFSFQLGAGRVISGWDKGVLGMKVGGKRKLTIPSDLGYGARGVGPIPPQCYAGLRGGTAGREVTRFHPARSSFERIPDRAVIRSGILVFRVEDDGRVAYLTHAKFRPIKSSTIVAW
jgi:peptidylprolyl isomerase/FKBP-type peptidyl-prolyl cis-trans isomerase FkpA